MLFKDVNYIGLKRVIEIADWTQIWFHSLKSIPVNQEGHTVECKYKIEDYLILDEISSIYFDQGDNEDNPENTKSTKRNRIENDSW